MAIVLEKDNNMETEGITFPHKFIVGIETLSRNKYRVYFDSNKEDLAKYQYIDVSRDELDVIKNHMY